MENTAAPSSAKVLTTTDTDSSPSRREATLKLIGICLIPTLVIAAVTSGLYIYTKSSTFAAVVLTIFTGGVYAVAIQKVAQWVEGIFNTKLIHNIEENIRRYCFEELWPNSNRPLVGVTCTILILLGAILPFVTLPLAFDPYTHSSLQGSSISFGSWNQTPQCVPQNESYQVNALENYSLWHACFSDAVDYKNFIYEAHMTISKGDCGGLLFRAKEGESATYQFEVCEDGTYGLYYYNNKSGGSNVFTLSCLARDDITKTPCTLAHATAATIARGTDQSNLLAVVANGSTLSIYVNHVLLASVEDQNFADGHIGVFADDISNPTTVVFSNMKVWTL